MPKRSPHISLAPERLLTRVFPIPPATLAAWPESVRDLAVTLAEEIFLIRYNPFIDAETVWKSVRSRLDAESSALSDEDYQILISELTRFWEAYLEDVRFRESLFARLREGLPAECIDASAHARVECSTDATDLRMELPLFVLTPRNTTHIQFILRLANEMRFFVIPRGGGSGLTGGAIPASARSVVLSMSRMKRILSVDPDNLVLCAQAGVITLNAIAEAAKKGMLFTVDPASKAASSLGGNISENAGGPFAFEYGTTLDNILSYTMVLPTGEVIEVRRVDHPRHKILPDERARFEVAASSGAVTDIIELHGEEIRSPGLGKDVTNKFLGGLPGIQKEGLDGVITEACFSLHPKPRHSRTLCLEFFGRSMRNAMLVIKDVVGLRDTIRTQGDMVKISALEEFGIKYVKAIEYTKKSDRYEGDPISVLLLQLDSDDEKALEDAVQAIVNIAEPYHNVDIFLARDAKEAELFWEDRHRLSAIARRTSGFKINEDIVIPLEDIPEFSDFIEGLNLHYLAVAYRKALRAVTGLPGFPARDEFIDMELDLAADVLSGKTTTMDLAEQEFEVQIGFFFQDLRSRYPRYTQELERILAELNSTRIIVANHMHAGDGNCHVNIPVNSNDQEMLHLAEEAAEKVFVKVVELRGQVSGEHGIGITKIAFLSEEKIAAIKAYKQRVDPNNVFNPGKLVQRRLPVLPYTFSFNKLIQDISRTSLPGKETLIRLLTHIQTCTRCGKCKQVCPMYYPEQGMMYHPRNKNITFGALIEAIYYSLIHSRELDAELMDELRSIVEHCTACGKCTAICPVKIKSSEVALGLRSFLEEKDAGGHPWKHRILNYLAESPSTRLPRAARAVTLGQRIQNAAVGFIPSSWRSRAESPLLRGKGPVLELTNLSRSLHLERGSMFTPQGEWTDSVLYFPGCGAGLFYRSVGMAVVALLLESRVAVILPPRHQCCGYPLLASGCEEAYSRNRENTVAALMDVLGTADDAGIVPSTVLTSCGTCRDALEGYGLGERLPSRIVHQDVSQYLLSKLPPARQPLPDRLVYHQACHSEWSGVPLLKAGERYAEALSTLLGGTPVDVSTGCCGESGLGALSSPEIYNRIRTRKKHLLEEGFSGYTGPIVVGCPSCKIGLSRVTAELHWHNPVVHTVELLADTHLGGGWKKDFLKKVSRVNGQSGVRTPAE